MLKIIQQLVKGILYVLVQLKKLIENELNKKERDGTIQADSKRQDLNNFIEIQSEISFGLSNEDLKRVVNIKKQILENKAINFNRDDKFLIYVAVANIIDENMDFYFLLRLFSNMEKLHYKDDWGGSFFQSLAQDCRIMTSQFDEYMSIHEKDRIISTSTHFANHAINVYFQANKEPQAIDLVRLTEARKSKFITANNELYLDMLDSVFAEYALPRGGWYKVMEKHGLFHNTYDFNMFDGIPNGKIIKAPFPSYCLYTNSDFNNICKILQREAESRARKNVGLKGVGEGWLSETLLYHELLKLFPNTEIVQHGKPDWLGRQHLDIWFKDWGIGVEYHGEQHFKPIDFFGGVEAFKKTQKRDELKKRKCKQNNLHLIIVTKGYNLDLLAEEIESYKRKVDK
ncbi:hypothetical protein ACLSZY_10800 [Avibacterium volantium]|uniref:hypothetical protein n=1 Tax=Avibacterium TaxID=292486 RepID=UPI0039FC97BB